jgi:hypothetical protein
MSNYHLRYKICEILDSLKQVRFSNLHGLKLFIVSGTSSKSRIVDIAATCRNLDEDVCLVLSGLHAISRCDSVSSLSGKGIPKVFEPVRFEKSMPVLQRVYLRIGSHFRVCLFLMNPRTNPLSQQQHC